MVAMVSALHIVMKKTDNISMAKFYMIMAIHLASSKLHYESVPNLPELCYFLAATVPCTMSLF